MIVRACTNKKDSLSPTITEFALPESNTPEELDITIGKHYAVYGTQIAHGINWYLVHTDTENKHSFWWMPAELYEIVDPEKPKGWTSISEDIESYTILSNPEIYEGLEDGDNVAIQKFNQIVNADETFPNDQLLTDLNKQIVEEALEKRNEVAKGRRWELETEAREEDL